MRSEDWIQGQVLRVLTGDTFELQVTMVGRSNDFPYDTRECIHIDSGAPPFEAYSGEESKDQLQEWLLGKTVRCYVHARDVQGELRCEVEIVDG